MFERLEAAIDAVIAEDAQDILDAMEDAMEISLAVSKMRVMLAGEDDFHEILEESTEDYMVDIADIRDEALAAVHELEGKRDMMLMSALLTGVIYV